MILVDKLSLRASTKKLYIAWVPVLSYSISHCLKCTFLSFCIHYVLKLFKILNIYNDVFKLYIIYMPHKSTKWRGAVFMIRIFFFLIIIIFMIISTLSICICICISVSKTRKLDICTFRCCVNMQYPNKNKIKYNTLLKFQMFWLEELPNSRVISFTKEGCPL